MSLSVITVTGMSCEHCEKAVRAEISAIPGVRQVDVDLASGQVKILAESAPEMAALRAAVEEAGYQLAEPSYRSLILDVHQSAPGSARFR